MMKSSFYLFDFDGTLVDSMPTFVSVMLRILDEYGIAHDENTVRIVGVRSKKVIMLQHPLPKRSDQ